jgi:hypothetical protein
VRSNTCVLSSGSLLAEVMVANAPTEEEHQHGTGMPDMGDMGM